MAVKIAAMHERSRLLRDRIRDGGMRVSQRTDGNAAYHVEIPRTVFVD